MIIVTGQAGITVVLFLTTFSYTLRENLAFSCELTLSGKRKLGNIKLHPPYTIRIALEHTCRAGAAICSLRTTL